jgi:hypothetical protein
LLYQVAGFEITEFTWLEISASVDCHARAVLISTILLRPLSPLVMRTDDRGTPKYSAISFITASLALPSRGWALTLTR